MRASEPPHASPGGPGRAARARAAWPAGWYVESWEPEYGSPGHEDSGEGEEQSKQASSGFVEALTPDDRDGSHGEAASGAGAERLPFTDCGPGVLRGPESVAVVDGTGRVEARVGMTDPLTGAPISATAGTIGTGVALVRGRRGGEGPNPRLTHLDASRALFWERQAPPEDQRRLFAPKEPRRAQAAGGLAGFAWSARFTGELERDGGSSGGGRLAGEPLYSFMSELEDEVFARLLSEPEELTGGELAGTGPEDDEAGLCSAGPRALALKDGPLPDLENLPSASRPENASLSAVGCVKTHQRAYLPPDEHAGLSDLPECHRSPLFEIAARGVLSCYLRLPRHPPDPLAGPWAGMIRLELYRQGRRRGEPASAVEAALASSASAACVALAGSVLRDGRAPQNLKPTMALERGLRRLMGETRLARRALRQVRFPLEREPEAAAD